jgi:hypothetical protein
MGGLVSPVLIKKNFFFFSFKRVTIGELSGEEEGPGCPGAVGEALHI